MRQRAKSRVRSGPFLMGDFYYYCDSYSASTAPQFFNGLGVLAWPRAWGAVRLGILAGDHTNRKLMTRWRIQCRCGVPHLSPSSLSFKFCLPWIWNINAIDTLVFTPSLWHASCKVTRWGYKIHVSMQNALCHQAQLHWIRCPFEKGLPVPNESQAVTCFQYYIRTLAEGLCKCFAYSTASPLGNTVQSY